MNISRPTWIVVALSILVTGGMDWAGYSAFSALPLLALIALFWTMSRHTWSDWGLGWGKPRDYGLALLYPVFVMGIIGAALALSGAKINDVDWQAALTAFATIALFTLPGAFLTEEGFFRGSLFTACQRDGLSARQTVVFSSLVFAAWHISWATLSEEGRLELHVLPIYLLNATLLGAVWGSLRLLSGSVLVAAVSHAVWNGMAYSLFGFGGDSGLLQVSHTALLDPERGLLAVLLNAAFLALLWRKVR
jgi:membrane protease YdiL (CAAX protease family)